MAMKRTLLFFLLLGAVHAQNTAKFPGSVPTAAQVGVARNRAETTLTSGINATATSIPVASSSNFAAGSFVTIDNEIMAVCSVPDGTHLNVGVSACPNVDGRGTDTTNGGGAAASHLASAKVQARIVAWNQNQLAAEVIALAKRNDMKDRNLREFGCKGDNVADDTACVQAAFNYYRANFPISAKGAFPDSRDGDMKLYVPRGVYRINGTIDVYAGVTVEGDASGSLIKSAFLQVDRTKPMFRIHPKNYAADNTVLNNSVGENVFRHLMFNGPQAGSGPGGEDASLKPLIQFMSPAESTLALAIPGDSAGGNVGHIDTLFDDVWFQWGQTAVSVDEGTFYPMFRGCTFDVTAVGIEIKGTAHGKIRLFNDHFYWNSWGALHINTTGEMDAEIANSWFTSNGSVLAADTINSAAIYFNSGNTSVGEMHISSSLFSWDNPQPGFRFGGHVSFIGRHFMMSDSKLMDLGGTGSGRPSHLYIQAPNFQVTNNYFQSTSVHAYDGATRMVIIETSNFSPGAFSDNIFQNDNAGLFAQFIDAVNKINSASFVNNRFTGPRTSAMSPYITDLPNYIIGNDGVNVPESIGSAPPVDANYTFPVGSLRWNDGSVTALNWGQPLGWVCGPSPCLGGTGWLPFGLIYRNSGQVNVVGPLSALSGGNVPIADTSVVGRSTHAVCWVSSYVMGHCSSSIGAGGTCTCVP